MKKRISFLLGMVMLILSVQAFAQGTTTVYINGQKQEQTITVAELDGTLLVPMRTVWDACGYQLSWDAMRQRIDTVTMIGKIKVQIGSILVSQIQGTTQGAYVLKTYPRLWSGVTMIPSEFATECTGANLKYIKENDALMIITQQN